MGRKLSQRDELALATARKMFNWYASPSDNEALLSQLLPPDVMRQVFNVHERLNMTLGLKRSMQRPGWQRTRLTLLKDWGHAFEPLDGLTLEDAWGFLRDCAGTLNHSVLYNQELVVGQTYQRKDLPSSDYVSTYHDDRPAWTLHFTEKGYGRYVAGSTIITQPGDLLLISPRASLHYERDERGDRWRHFWAMFQPEPHWHDYMQWRMATFGVYRLHLQKESERKRFRILFEEILELEKASTEANAWLIRNLFEQLLIRAQQTLAESHQPRTDPRVLEACKYIEDHLTQPLAVGDIAEHCNISESRLAHLFQENLEQGIKAFQASLRAQRAKRLLATTRETVAVVGAKVGYDDPAQFSKFFRKHLGCSPRQFRVQFSSSG